MTDKPGNKKQRMIDKRTQERAKLKARQANLFEKDASVIQNITIKPTDGELTTEIVRKLATMYVATRNNRPTMSEVNNFILGCVTDPTVILRDNGGESTVGRRQLINIYAGAAIKDKGKTHKAKRPEEFTVLRRVKARSGQIKLSLSEAGKKLWTRMKEEMPDEQALSRQQVEHVRSLMEKDIGGVGGGKDAQIDGFGEASDDEFDLGGEEYVPPEESTAEWDKLRSVLPISPFVQRKFGTKGEFVVRDLAADKRKQAKKDAEKNGTPPPEEPIELDLVNFGLNNADRNLVESLEALDVAEVPSDDEERGSRVDFLTSEDADMYTQSFTIPENDRPRSTLSSQRSNKTVEEIDDLENEPMTEAQFKRMQRSDGQSSEIELESSPDEEETVKDANARKKRNAEAKKKAKAKKKSQQKKDAEWTSDSDSDSESKFKKRVPRGPDYQSPSPPRQITPSEFETTDDENPSEDEENPKDPARKKLQPWMTKNDPRVVIGTAVGSKRQRGRAAFSPTNTPIPIPERFPDLELPENAEGGIMKEEIRRHTQNAKDRRDPRLSGFELVKEWYVSPRERRGEGVEMEEGEKVVWGPQKKSWMGSVKSPRIVAEGNLRYVKLPVGYKMEYDGFGYRKEAPEHRAGDYQCWIELDKNGYRRKTKFLLVRADMFLPYRSRKGLVVEKPEEADRIAPYGYSVDRRRFAPHGTMLLQNGVRIISTSNEVLDDIYSEYRESEAGKNDFSGTTYDDWSKYTGYTKGFKSMPLNIRKQHIGTRSRMRPGLQLLGRRETAHMDPFIW